MIKKSFTLIEVLIAVIVFGIGILTILIMISRNIALTDRIKLKTTATFLAKEGLEIAFNKRDSNVLKGLARNCVIVDSSYNCIDRYKFNIGKYYKAYVNITGYISMQPTTSGYDANIVYFHTGVIKQSTGVPITTAGWYDYSSGDGQKTIYSRYIHFDGLYLDPDKGIGDPNKILKINSVVEYKKGAFTGEVVLESIIGER